MKKSFNIVLGTAAILGGLAFGSAIPVNAATTDISSVVKHEIKTSTVNESEDNLMQNGDFSQGLDSWISGGFGGGAVSVKTDENGNYAELTNPVPDSGAALGQDISTAPLKKYQMSFEYKGTSSSQLLFEPIVHTPIGDIPGEGTFIKLTNQSGKWVKHTQSYSVPANGAIGSWNVLETGFVTGSKGTPASETPMAVRNVKLTEVK
ncbi:carbohydrate binding domain-containing protein [Lentilactobacillus sp. SPB1-3]|uniref:Carbohydrate binding domain-containing protein n=1 Tax=Lentilactobacillus terminaliae TaxID=3003483 RepID=A0ACD5DCU1_9LACO|nr:carbohydrate binding domain-containing protein [Lentilactobacillus sp. SPB1-3]MCZ0978130.1 carbohydrate binding domain-containing protein [Lentilactobacillus sp. SPB1-3]